MYFIMLIEGEMAKTGTVHVGSVDEELSVISNYNFVIKEGVQLLLL